MRWLKITPESFSKRRISASKLNRYFVHGSPKERLQLLKEHDLSLLKTEALIKRGGFLVEELAVSVDLIHHGHSRELEQVMHSAIALMERYPNVWYFMFLTPINDGLTLLGYKPEDYVP